ncbi:MAG: cell surface protein SprA [Bacteroidota bacterium]
MNSYIRAGNSWLASFGAYNYLGLFNFNYFMLMPMQFEFEDLSPVTDTSFYERPPLFRMPEFSHDPVIGHSFGSRTRKNIPGLEINLDLDSTLETLRYSERVDQYEITYPYELELDTYLARRKKQLQRRAWDSLLTYYDMKKALEGGDLAMLISQAAGLTIPVPPNPVMGIFGKPEISINVQGEVNLRVGWRWDSQNLGTVSAFGQTQSTPMFHQDIRLNVSGRIGDKLKLGTDWNTRRTMDYDNQFKIGYEGEDDEIIKRVEVGNVTLPLQSSLIGGGQALFGARVDFQFGPLYLKTIFSQRRGERKFVNVQGGSSKQPFELRAYDYAKNHFFVDTAYKEVYKEYFKYSTPVIPPSASSLRIKELQVWEATSNIQDAALYSANAIAYADLEPKRLKSNESYPNYLKQAGSQTGVIEKGNFVRLDSNRFSYDRNLGTLTIHNLRQERYYAVSYRVEGPTTAVEDDLYYGTALAQGERDTLLLKLIYRPNMQPGFTTLWDRQMKNIYSINATNVNVQDTRIGIWYIRQSNDSADVLEGAPDKLVTIFGVDQVNNSTGQPPGDGIFDLKPPFFDPVRGEITFPSPEPFRDGLREYFRRQGNPEMAEQYVFPEVYDTTYDVARRNTTRDRFVITGEVSGRATNRISLGAYNLAPGSVKVTLDGVPLREFDDYIVDYFTGTLTIRNQRATLPNANLKIEYEQHDVFNASTRTLAGLRGDYILHESRNLNTILGFTLMHYDQSAIIDRVRLGEEPVANTMFGLDGRLEWNAPVITRILDNLPFYDTKAQSSLSIGGEWAMIDPLPNKRISSVASDMGQPVVYVDDFEGAQRNISLGLNANMWQHSSQPVDSSIGAHDTTRAYYRGNSFWFQYFTPYVPYNEVYPNSDVISGRSNLNPLEIVFNPDERGIYNKNPEFLDRFNPEFDSLNIWSQRPENRNRIWSGMTRLFSSFNTNFDTENIEYIEVMMKLDYYEPGTRMYIDLGQISEDIIPNGFNNTEDGITAAAPIANNIIDPGEDIGIDALSDEQEQVAYPYPLNLEDDPARDNYAFDFGQDNNDQVLEDFRFYNNFEGNAQLSELGQFPDREVLNDNNGQSIITANDYFEYEIVLDQNPQTNNQIVGANNGWLLFRIPIRKPVRRVGNPLFSNIQYIRVWYKGGALHARIADWNLVGSQWQRVSNLQSGVQPNDSVLSIAFVNVWENSGEPDFYTMPPGVRAPRQLNNPDPNKEIKLNEQSLSVSVKNLRYGDERMATRIFRPMDIFYYKEMKFFVHGDGSMPDNVVRGAIPKGNVFLRFGTDSSNYYEYKRPITRGWQDISIDLQQLTAVKQIRDTSAEYDRQTFAVDGDPLAQFSIKGNPVLTRVQFFGVGVENPAERFPNELTTTIWVDELRLIKPEMSRDWAGVANVDLKLADLGSVNASFQHTKPNFHRLEERFGDRVTTTNWSVSMQGNLEKFAPRSFSQMKIPITYTHSEITRDPQFVANNDINLEEAANADYRNALLNGATPEEAQRIANETRRRSQTVRIQDSWALTGVKLGIPVDHWLINETLNKVNVGYSYSQEFERSPVYAERFNWMWRLNAQYAVNFPEFAAVSPFGFFDGIPGLSAYKDAKLNFFPSNLSVSMNMQRRRQTEQSRFLDYPSPVLRDFSVARNAQFSWKLSEGGFLNPAIDYSMQTNSTLVPYELDENGNQRTGAEMADVIFFHNGNFVNFGRNNMHNQAVTLNFKPQLPDFGGLPRYVDMTGSYNVNYSWQDPLQPDPAIANIAKQTGWNKSVRFNMGLRLKSMADSWFGVTPQRMTPQKVPADTSGPGGIMSDVGDIFKTVFLDWEKIDFNFTQSSSSSNPGVFGGTGLSNFWGRGLTFRDSRMMYGPSFAYQLGLISNPHGGFHAISSPTFPFFSFETYPGLRPPNGVMQDVFNEKTSLQATTSRPLWEGAVLDLNWKTDLGYNRNQTVVTDENGFPEFTNVIAMESFNRTYFTWPTVFGFNLFNNTIEHVIDLYNQQKAQIEATATDTVSKNLALQEALSESFYNGLEAFSLFGGAAGKFLPAINWAIRWEGIEKWDLWGGTLKRLSVMHAYVSTYQENVQITDNGRAVQTQQVQSGFQPLIEVTAGFDEEKLDGNLTASLRVNTTNQYQINTGNRAGITKQSTTEITSQASYQMRGFEFPFLGINLQNDLEFSFLATYKANSRGTFNILEPESLEGGDAITVDGSTQIILEPQARYSLSNRLTAAFFVRYEGTFTEGAANPGFHTTQVGLDIRISLAGGR